MYELILTMMVRFAGPVAELDSGHRVAMVTQQYTIAVQGFTSQQDCMNYAGYRDLESSLASTFGANTRVVPESRPRCILQPT